MSNIYFQWLKHGESGGNAAPLLQVKGLTVQVGVREVLTDIDIDVFLGDHVRITGPNGSGKSTLCNAIAGIEPARIVSGQICFNGQNITRMPAHERAALGITYMRQMENVFQNLTVSENLILALGKDGYERFSQTFPNWTHELSANKRAGQLSGGQKKKLAWSMSLLGGKKLFLADEPDAGVDQKFELPDGGCTYVEISHP